MLQLHLSDKQFYYILWCNLYYRFYSNLHHIQELGVRESLAQVMMAPSHYLNQCCLIISEVLWHSKSSWWILFFRVPARAEMLHILDKWHVAYHGTQVAALRKILDTGDLKLGEQLTHWSHDWIAKFLQMHSFRSGTVLFIIQIEMAACMDYMDFDVRCSQEGR